MHLDYTIRSQNSGSINAVVLPFGGSPATTGMGPFIYSHDDSIAYFGILEKSQGDRGVLYGVRTDNYAQENSINFGPDREITCMISFPETKIVVVALRKSNDDTMINAVDTRDRSSYSMITWGLLSGGNMKVDDSEVKSMMIDVFNSTNYRLFIPTGTREEIEIFDLSDPGASCHAGC